MRKLEELKYDATRYEVGIEIKGAFAMVVGYTARKSLRGLSDILSAAEGARNAIALAMDPDAEYDIRQTAARGIEFVGVARVFFTGRTERDAICEAMRAERAA